MAWLHSAISKPLCLRRQAAIERWPDYTVQSLRQAVIERWPDYIVLISVT